MSQLGEMKVRAEKATPGPWAIDANDTSPFESINSIADDRIGGWVEVARSLGYDADFIAHARTDVPKLLAALEAVEATLLQIDEISGGTSADADAYGRGIDRGLQIAVVTVRKTLTEALA